MAPAKTFGGEDRSGKSLGLPVADNVEVYLLNKYQ